MKKYALIFFSIILYACGGNPIETQTDFSKITFKLDTVLVDPGDEILNLKYGLWQSIITEDKKYLYLWNPDESNMAKINLDELILEDKIPFEKEGPDGVGSFISWMNILEDDKFIIANFRDIGLFDQSGKKIRTYNVRGEKFAGDSLKEGESFGRKSIVTESGDVIYGLMGNWIENSFSFVKINFENKSAKRFEFPGLEELPDYSIMLRSGQSIMVVGTDKGIEMVEDKIIYSSSAYADLFILDVLKDSVFRVSYTPKLTAKSKRGNYPKEVDSKEDFDKINMKIREEINFSKPLWDEKNKRFLRFSYETYVIESSPVDSESDKYKTNLFLTIFDEDFNLLRESLVSEIQSVPSSFFVKDGWIWSYVNVDDELGFVRMEIKY